VADGQNGSPGGSYVARGQVRKSNGARFHAQFRPESARRQLRMSIMLVVAMGFAAFVLGFASPIDAQKP